MAITRLWPRWIPTTLGTTAPPPTRRSPGPSSIRFPKSWLLRSAAPVAVEGLVYNGREQTGVASTGEGCTVSDGTATHAGSFTAIASLANPNYAWTDGTTADKEIAWSIARAANVLTVSTGKVVLTGTPAEARTFTRIARATSGSVVYQSSSKYVRVSSTGKVTVAKNFCGTAKVTVLAPETEDFEAASPRSFSIAVKPGSMTLGSAVNAKGRVIKAKWAKMTGADGYRLRYRVKGSSKWSVKTVSSSKAACIIGGLKKGKAYQVQICAYDKQTKTWGAWGKVKTVKVAK